MPTRSTARQVRDGFPRAVPADGFVASLEASCRAGGFDPGHALLLAGACRDEVCFPFVGRLEAIWGPAFHIGSLGGLLMLGRSGLAAAAHHAPQDPGQPQRFVVVACAHIGMDGSGSFGYLRREHQSASSRACGALMGFRDELVTGRLALGFDPADPEMSLLRQRVFSALHYGDVPEPVELTEVVAGAIREDLDDMLAWYTARPGLDGAVAFHVTTGVLVHAPAGDWFSVDAQRTWRSGPPDGS